MDQQKTAHKTTKALFLIFILLFLTPILSSKLLPMQDLPAHEAVISVYTNILAGSDYLSRYYETQSLIQPYNNYYIFAALLGRIMPIEIYTRVFLLVVFILYGSVLYKIAKRSESILPIAGLPYFYNITYYFGMVNFLLSLPAILFATDYFLNSPGRCRDTRWFLVINSIQLIMFFIHPAAYFLFLVISVVALGGRFLKGLTAARPFLKGFLFPAALVSLWLKFGFFKLLESSGASSPGIPDFSHTGGILSYLLKAEWQSGRLLINQLIDSVFLPFSPVQQAVQAAAMIPMVIVLVIGIRRAGPSLEVQGIVKWLLLVTIILLLPFEMFHVTYLSTRCLAFAIPLFFVIVRMKVSREIAMRVAIVFFLLTSCINLVVQHQRFSKEASGGIELVEMVEPRKKVLSLVVTGKSASVTSLVDPFIHIHHRYLVMEEGYISAFVKQPLFPVRPVEGAGFPFPERYLPIQFSWKEHGVHHDRILVKMSKSDSQTTPTGRKLVRELLPRCVILGNIDDWFLLAPREPVS